MKLSTKGRYSIRFMLDLAAHYGKGPVLLREVSEREDISEKYLWHLVNPLKSVGLIRTTRGAKGGFELAKPPSAITVKEIFEVVEGPACLVDCVGEPGTCERSSFCVARDLWREASDALAGVLSKTTLAMMVEKLEQKKRSHALNYDI
ncbi:Rrf2 family transcriptional regulator [bacterium]|nr:Rrf2 family transcriptional regulator [bacterium]